MQPNTSSSIINESSPLIPQSRAGAFAPEQHPFTWTLVNAVLFVWSATILFEILSSWEGPLTRRYGQRLYLVWNFFTTVVWCLEAGLIVCYHRAVASKVDVIQLVVAAYFLVDSAHLPYLSQISQISIAKC